ncbi:MAG: NUDIX domain-containing protein [Bacteroidia bacterium]|nr:NUDIX domain-containing protein [Bacteroidia bacterium]MDW8235775.1 NUDIX domain-containing protein [Bacteroidia bacterium]
MGSAASAWLSRYSANEAAQSLLLWYRRQGRRLPWRETRDPYRIWVIETLLQQTRILQAQTYIQRFFEAFPDLETLANASLNQVLAVWQGLGYYQRAYHLHQTAQKLYQGGGWSFLDSPQALENLLALPGIGSYTARAILCFTEKGKYLPVDGNLVRVLARLWKDTTPATQRSAYQAQADTLPDIWKTREVAFALMDLGQLHCLPQRPECLLCPMQRFCWGAEAGLASQLPIRKQKAPRPVQYWHFWLHADGKHVWLEQRPPRGIWGSLWCLPAHPLPKPPKNKPAFKHAFTHFELWGYVERVAEPPSSAQPVPWTRLCEFALPTPIKRLLHSQLPF